MSKDDALHDRLVYLSKQQSELKVRRLTSSEARDELGIPIARSANPIYLFSVGSGDQYFEAIAFTSILDGAKRPATRAEALGHSIANSGEDFFKYFPFIIVFDYTSGRFMAVSAAKLFTAFATEASNRKIPFADSAAFSLTPNFERRTVNMYGTVESEDIWWCGDVDFLTGDEMMSGLHRMRSETEQTDLIEIITATTARVAATPKEIEVPELSSSGHRLSYSASLVTQGRHKFYSLAMPSEILADCSFVITRDEDRELGFQRYLNKERAEEIAAYLDSGLGTIPTAIIVSAQEECAFEYSGKNRTVSFNRTDKAFLVIDGQHRVYGFKLAKNTMRVPVVIYSGLDRNEEAQLFIDINTKQKPVPSELLLDIKKLAKTQGNDEKRIGTVFDLFDSEPGSALIGMLSPHEKKSGLISRVTFNAALKPLMEFFGETDAEQIYLALNAYYGGVKSAFAALSPDIEFASPMTFRGMTLVFPELREKVVFKSEGDLTSKSYQQFLLAVLADQKISALKGRQRSYAGVVALITDAMRPKRLQL